MSKHIDDAYAKVSILLEQIHNNLSLIKPKREVLKEFLDPYIELLEQTFTEDVPIAKIKDNSNLIIHAEGEALSDDPTLKAVSRTFESTTTTLSDLLVASFDKAEPSSVKNQINLSLTGLAPGSLILGVSCRASEKMASLFADESSLDIDRKIGSIIDSFVLSTDFISEKGINPEINDAIQDPLLRDSTLLAALSITPTGRQGVSSIEFYTPNGRSSTRLTPHIRKSLRRDIRRGFSQDSTKRETFFGKVRVLNLDTSRFIITLNNGLKLRCFYPGLDNVKARRMLDRYVTVTGACIYDKLNVPRLLTLTTDPQIFENNS